MDDTQFLKIIENGQVKALEDFLGTAPLDTNQVIVIFKTLSPSLIECMLKFMRVNCTFDDLVLVLAKGRLDVLKVLIMNNALPSYMCEENKKSILDIISKNAILSNSPAMLDYLLEYGMIAESSDLIYYAISAKRCDSFSYLIERGVNFDSYRAFKLFINGIKITDDNQTFGFELFVILLSATKKISREVLLHLTSTFSGRFVRYIFDHDVPVEGLSDNLKSTKFQYLIGDITEKSDAYKEFLLIFACLYAECANVAEELIANVSGYFGFNYIIKLITAQFTARENVTSDDRMVVHKHIIRLAELAQPMSSFDQSVSENQSLTGRHSAEISPSHQPQGYSRPSLYEPECLIYPGQPSYLSTPPQEPQPDTPESQAAAQGQLGYD